MVENFHWFLWRTTPENISPVIYVKNSFISYPGFTVLYEPAGQAVWILPDLIRRTPGNDPTAFLSSSRSHIDDVIRISYNIKIMFDNNQCCSMINEGLETWRSVFTSCGCSPMVGSSKTNAESLCPFPISLASFSR